MMEFWSIKISFTITSIITKPFSHTVSIFNIKLKTISINLSTSDICSNTFCFLLAIQYYVILFIVFDNFTMLCYNFVLIEFHHVMQYCSPALLNFYSFYLSPIKSYFFDEISSLENDIEDSVWSHLLDQLVLLMILMEQ